MTKKRTAAQWQQLIQAQQESDLTVSQFCSEHKLAPSNFYAQRNKYRQPKGQTKEDTWLPLNDLIAVEQDERHWKIELTLPNGVVLNMSSLT